MSSEAFIPMHRKIFEILRGKICSRFWKYGEKMPSTEALCGEFSVSAITVRTALRNLRKEGFVKSVRGHGTYVSWRKEDEYYGHFAARKSGSIEIVHSLLSPLPGYSYIMNLLASAFMERNPHTSVKFIEMRPQNSEDPYLKRLASGKMPTCGEFFWHTRYAKDSALYPLEKFPDFDELKSDLIPGAFYPTEDGEGKPHVHALNLYLGIPQFSVLNGDIASRAGIRIPDKITSWDHIFRILRGTVSKLGADVHGSAIALPFSYHGVKPLLEIMGQDLFQDKSTAVSLDDFLAVFESGSALSALETFRRLKGIGRPVMQKTNEYFALGDVCFLVSGSTWTLNLIDMIDPEMNCVFLPVPPVGANRRYRSFCSCFSVGIFRNGIASDSQLYAAWEWLRFLFHTRSQTLLSQNFTFPVRKDADYILKRKNPLLHSLAKNMLKNALPQPDFMGIRQAYGIAGQHFMRFMLDDGIGPERCLKNIRDDLNRAFR